MPELEVGLLALTVVGFGLGAWAVCWARMAHGGIRARWGRRGFVATQFTLCAGCLVAAFHRADGLVPLGLTAGGLVILMLWESPEAGLVGDRLPLVEEV